MAPRRDKNKMVDEAECSAAANKRKRGVAFRNPIAEFATDDNNNFRPQWNLLQSSNVFSTGNFGSGVQLSTPVQQEAVNDSFIDWVMPQQSFLINYHTNIMLQSMEDFWRRSLAEEIKKKKEIETKLKEQEEQANRFRQMYYFYEQRTFHLEQMVEQQVAAERFYAAPPVALEEEVQSCLVDRNNVQRMDVKCKNCQTRPATMLWLPCRHLCVCLVCEKRVKTCPICSVKKSESFKIDLP